MITQETLKQIIAAYWRLHGRSPTYREIGDIAGTDATTAYKRTKLLEFAGALEYRPPRKHRCRVIVVATQRKQGRNAL